LRSKTHSQAPDWPNHVLHPETLMRATGYDSLASEGAVKQPPSSELHVRCFAQRGGRPTNSATTPPDGAKPQKRSKRGSRLFALQPINSEMSRIAGSLREAEPHLFYSGSGDRNDYSSLFTRPAL